MPNTTNPTGSNDDMWFALDPNGDQIGDKGRMLHAIGDQRDSKNHANDPSEISNTRHMQQLAQNYTPNHDPMRADRPLSVWPESQAAFERDSKQPTSEPQVDELFELCKEVYKRTGWEGGKTLASDTEGDKILFVVSNDFHELGHNAWRVAYLYDSDYLLQKLPDGVAVNNAHGVWGAWVAMREVETLREADTPLKALLELTVALDDAKELPHAN